MSDIGPYPLHKDSVPGARYWSFVVKRGHVLRLTDLEGGANAGVLLYNADNLVERYNMADTLKGQHTAHLTAGHVLFSDMGRVLMSIVADDFGWHDTICGFSDGAMVREQYGEADFQDCRNDFHRNGRELFLIEMAKWGLGRKDLVPNLNFFSKVTPDDYGALTFASEHGAPGRAVTLRADMNVLVVLQSAPHPLDPATDWAPKPVGIELFEGEPMSDDDLCLNSSGEARRAFANNAIWDYQI